MGTTHFSGPLLVTKGYLMKPVAIADVTAYTVLAGDTGKLHIMPNVTADITYIFPSAQDGLVYDFIYNGTGVDSEAHIFATAATDELFAGGVVFHDHNIGGAGIEVLAVYADFSNDDLMTVDLPQVGTHIHFVSDGSSWFVWGQVISDTAPVFA